MSAGETRYTLDRIVRMAIAGAVIYALVRLLQHLSDVLIPFVAAVILAYLLNPLVTFVQRKIRHRGLAVAATLAGLGLLVLALGALLVPMTMSQVDRFRHDLGKLRSDLAASAARAAEARSPEAQPAESAAEPSDAPKSSLGWTELKDAWVEYRRDAGTQSRAERIAEFRERLSGTYLGQTLDDAIAYLQSDEFRNFLVEVAKKVAVGGWTVLAFAGSLILGLTGLIIVLIYLVFLLLDFPEYARTWTTFLPPNYRESTVDFLVQFDGALRQYFRGQSLIALLTGTILATGFTIIGLPMAVLFGLFVGLLNMVPYLAAVSIVPALLLAGLRAIETDTSFLWSVMLTLIVYAVAQLTQDWVLTPKILGKTTGLRPVAILLSVFIWGKLLGFLGLLLSIPLTCLAIAYYRRYVLTVAPQRIITPPEIKTSTEIIT